ncbi:SDR family NAD(P)-dependent oxidoreductase [Algibacter amylolyticus]|uniref:SDR family NAD(P)-dependent oxidoreductase n=1 Tax=Algibacter amylolyticus TaxID=1608400 RepID=A0A5M7BBE3_9FLAO|nr:SDR family NAD(P)-dependent oxidoreductase [Algibacter amylolyticus]KAA5825577.1 SDR family NAD(P)-dependent oxidoreductase [Algibacter amylolyticus]MBB5268198.1 FlaA1/EpsC-like NDP-sugar epimerase [Algibacter amylolyticus]TSJ79875.1 SDR family NAD(P)-dependent oxidoreductase [Algibacter amylolyticus]
MNIEIKNYIDELLNDSGLFSLSTSIRKEIQFDFSNDVILITGAAGSIGSGLVHQLTHSNYKKLILIDNAESPLYQLIKELEFEAISNVDFKLIDITDKEAIKNIFEQYKPSIIFHTAAYKHVPLLESNAFRAININVIGTTQLADLAHEFNVKKFIFISTDKAVNPINVMGLTKKIGENYTKLLNSKSDTLFINTRFGNILGSNGSLVPLLKKQIDFGHPVTITDKNISRYFISKHKACKLILKLANNNNYKETTYTFNMGDPIKIIDIVNRLIIKCQKKPASIELKTTGLRPGEKFNEEIISSDEILIPTDDIDLIIVKQKIEKEIKAINFQSLLKITPRSTNQEIKAILKSLI